MSGALQFDQAKRRLRISTPLGANTVALRRLAVRESIGRPFSLVAEIVSTDLDIKPAALIGKTITCTVAVGHAPPRHFHGLVRSFARVGAIGRGLGAYRLEAVPRLWNLSRTADCRIFQDKSVKDICTAIFGEHGVAPVRWGGSVPTAKRGYCVQFNETDFDFVQRLLEEIGCGYFFEHKDTDHTLVIGGANADYPLVPGNPLVVRADADVHGALVDWKPQASLQPGKVRVLDFDGLRPGTLLDKQAATILSTPAGGALEMFRWPGGQTVRADGDPAKLAMEGFEAGADMIAASGNVPTVFAGGRLKVMSGLDATQAGTWLVTDVSHDAMDETHLVDDGTAHYSNSLSLMPGDRPWRPPGARPRPMMPGVHSAIVTGPAGEEIHCDEHGRVKLHFHWDRAGKTDDTASCWVRVAQSFAGKWGGTWTLPRIGDEVLVAFVDGDPDRPVVIGSVYNAEQKPIYSLPANKTQSGIKTRSSKGGGASNFNELRFEDKKGAEEINVQAEKDIKILVKNDRTEHIKHDRTETVDNDHTEAIGNNRSATVKKGNESLKVETGNMSTEVSKGNKSIKVGMGNLATEVSMGNKTVKVAMGNLATEVSMGDITEKAALGNIEIEAMQSITLKCGQSKITLKPAEISIESVMIKIKGQAMLETKAPMAKHEADAIMTIKGGLVLIN